jgi:hypothetical protein
LLELFRAIWYNLKNVPHAVFPAKAAEEKGRAVFAPPFQKFVPKFRKDQIGLGENNE